MSIADTLPGIRVEIGFGVDAVGGDYFVLDHATKGELDGATYLLAPDDVFVDVSANVAAITTSRGRERELEEYRPGTASVVFNDNDRTFDPAYEGTDGYVDLPGSSGNYLSTPDAAALDLAGDLCIVWHAFDIAAQQQLLINKSSALSFGNVAYALRNETDGRWTLFFENSSSALSSPQTTVGDFDITTRPWLAVVLDANDGSGKFVVRWYDSPDPDTDGWTLRRTNNGGAGVTAVLRDTSDSLEIGGRAAGTLMFNGSFDDISIRDGIGVGGTVGGTEVFHFSADSDIVDTAATAITASTGQTVTVHKSGSPATTLVETTGRYFGQITPMRRIAIYWQSTPLFTGWVQDWTVTYEPGDRLSRVTVDCVDGFGILANQQLSAITPAFSGDLAGERIERILDRPEVDFPATRDIDDGNSTLGDTTLDDNALAYLQACARAEAGYLFVAADGTLTFRNRLAVLNAPTGITFTDDRESDGIPYRNVTQRSSADLLYTRVTATSETTETEVEAVDSDAYNDYFIRTLSLGTVFTIDDTETQALVDSYLERYSSVELRFQTATVNLASCSVAQVQQVVSLDLTDVVTVERSPLNVGSTIERRSMIDGVSHRIGHGHWTVDVSFANADTRAFLMLDDSVFGELDANRVAF